MSSFAYDQTQANEIVSLVTQTNAFLHVPSQELRTRDLERTSKKLIAHDLHCTTLAEYYRLSRIPRGLRSHLQPTLFKENNEFCHKFESILNKCSLDLMVLTIEFLQKSIQDTKAEVTSIETQLADSLPKEEWDSLKLKTEKILTDYRRNTEERKRVKFIRDAEDYSSNRVYRWHDNPRNTRWRTPRTYPDSATSGSDSDYATHNRGGPFLGARAGRTQGRTNQRGGRGGNTADNLQNRVMTRSQVGLPTQI